MVEYPFVNKHEACKILGCSESTLRRRMQTDLHKDIHWVQRGKGEALKFNQRLLEDYVAHLGDPDAHLGAIARLERERDRLLSEGLALPGAWIETGQISGRKWRQAYWRAVQPIFGGKKRCYIGKENSPAHQKAQQAIARRKRLEAIDRQLCLID